MNRRLRRIRGALGMGLIWAVVWAPIAVVVGMIVDPDGSMDEMWVAIGAYPGFIIGVLFSLLLGIAERRRKFDELSLARMAMWGGAAGFFLALLPFAISEPTSNRLLLALATVGPFTLLGALSAAGSLALARRSADRDRLTPPSRRGPPLPP